LICLAITSRGVWEVVDLDAAQISAASRAGIGR
jgi:hypothetical protein